MHMLIFAAALSTLSAAPAPPAHDCGAPRAAQVAQHAPMQAQKLGQLPDAEMDLAVIRRLGGCWVRQVVRFHVSDPNAGATTQGSHVPGFTGTLVPDGKVAKPIPTAR
ncbi:MAG TPA: hypothetical protein VIJ94_17470 [Caulobacteraceae bacterium]